MGTIPRVRFWGQGKSERMRKSFFHPLFFKKVKEKRMADCINIQKRNIKYERRMIKMKKMNAIWIVMLTVGLLAGTGFAGRRGQGGVGMGTGAGFTDLVSQYPYQDLSEEERAGLIKMREEEKLARDVYLTLFNKWNHRVFSNIANSEQMHMDAVKSLLDKYGMTDPVVDNTAGVFTDPHMTELYNALVQKGSMSIVDALSVGATIEDLDIYDLNILLTQTDNEDVQVAYQNLTKGSRNHMRAFTRTLGVYGVTYTAQYLAQEEVDQIISRSWE